MAWRSVAVAMIVSSSIVACGKTRADTRTKTERPPCAVEVEGLRTYLDDVAADGYVHSDWVPARNDPHRYLARPLPVIPLVPVDEPPKYLMEAAILSLHHGQGRFGDDAARISDVAAMDGLIRRTAESGLSPEMGVGNLGSFSLVHPIVMFVAEGEPWGEVTGLVDAATRGGFAQVEFVFEAKARALPPADGIAKRRMVAIAANGDEMSMKRYAALAKELARMTPACSELAKPFASEVNSSTDADERLQAFVRSAPDTFRACACQGDPEAIKVFVWTQFGRHWGTTTVAYEVTLATQAVLEQKVPLEKVAGSANTPWREMTAAVINASKKTAPVRFEVR